MHNKYFLHRDIKPENILIGIGEKISTIYLIDFGLAKRYKDPNTLKHISFCTNKSLIGTARYASVNAHMGFEQSRRDDLESIGNTLIYMYKGMLPWQGIQESNKNEKYRKIMQKKISTSCDQLCIGCLSHFAKYMKICKELRFEEDPDYGNLKKLFKDALAMNNFEEDYEFDWTLIRV
jgi:serine/threonine protein kinase